MPRVLLTRPLPQAEKLAQRLRALGYEALIDPLLTIWPTHEVAPGGNFQAVIMTSASALSVLSRGACQPYLPLPCFCVGARTAEAARDFGFTHVHSAEGDSVKLAAMVAGFCRPDQGPLLHIAGRDVAGAGRDVLALRGFTVTSWVVYEARAAAQLSGIVKAALAARAVDVVPIFSPRSGSVFASLIKRERLEACCASLIAVGISEAALTAVRGLPWRSQSVAPQPDEDALIAQLQKIIPARETSMTMPTEPSPVTETEAKPVAKRHWIYVAALGLVVLLAAMLFMQRPLSQPSREAVPVTGGMEARMAALEERVRMLEARGGAKGVDAPAPVVADAASVPAVAPVTAGDPAVMKLQNDMTGLATAMAALQADVKHTGDAAAEMRGHVAEKVGQAVAFIQLRDAAQRGAAFRKELALMREASKNDGEVLTLLVPLEAQADGAPTAGVLQQELISRLPAVRAALEKAEAQTWWQRVVAALRSLVSVRPLHSADNDIISVVDSHLRAGDAIAAMESFKDLPESVQKNLEDWQVKLAARQQMDMNIEAIATRLTRAVGE